MVAGWIRIVKLGNIASGLRKRQYRQEYGANFWGRQSAGHDLTDVEKLVGILQQCLCGTHGLCRMRAGREGRLSQIADRRFRVDVGIVIDAVDFEAEQLQELVLVAGKIGQLVQVVAVDLLP